MSQNSYQIYRDQEQPDGLCKTARILGICSIIFPIAIIALIVSIIALVKVDENPLPHSKRLAGIGLITSLVGLVTSWFWLVGGAVMFPFMSAAKYLGMATTCLSNEKQIALGLSMYADDYDERFPLKENWQSDIRGYIKTEKVFICPSAKVPADSYAMRGERSGASRIKLPDLSKTVIAFDSDLPNYHSYGGFEAVAYRHYETANFMFADGHAKPVKHSQMQQLKPAAVGQ